MNPDPHNRTLSRQERMQRFKAVYNRRSQPRRLYGDQSYASHDDALTSLITDWNKPRYALPSLGYLNPLHIGLAQFYAAMVFFGLGFASYQLWYAYASGEGLDISSVGFIGPALMYLVAAVGAAAQLRRMTLRWGLRRQARAETVINHSEIELSPVESGIMLDAYSEQNEILATLTSLQTKGYIDMQLPDGSSGLRLTPSQQPLSDDERVFLQYLFAQGPDLSEFTASAALTTASSKMHRAAYDRLVSRGDIPLLSAWGKIQFFVLKSFSIVGFAIGVLIFFQIFDENSYRINYPRYPVELWQLSFIILLLAILIFIPLQAYFTNVFSKQGMDKYRQAAGLYMYIETVLKGRFDDGRLAQSEIDYYLPYAQAFGLDE